MDQRRLQMTFLSECLDGACIIIRTVQFCLDTLLSMSQLIIQNIWAWGSNGLHGDNKVLSVELNLCNYDFRGLVASVGLAVHLCFMGWYPTLGNWKRCLWRETVRKYHFIPCLTISFEVYKDWKLDGLWMQWSLVVTYVKFSCFKTIAVIIRDR